LNECLSVSSRRFNAAGTRIVTASIAVHSSYNQSEAWQERTDWVRLVAFAEAGEALAGFGKGDRIQCRAGSRAARTLTARASSAPV
jgi:single-stranded DNA-binding protein